MGGKRERGDEEKGDETKKDDRGRRRRTPEDARGDEWRRGGG